MHLEFQLTQDEFAEAVAAATARKAQHRSRSRRIITSIAAVISTLLFLSALGVVAYFRFGGFDGDPHAIANAIEVPAPWVFLFVLLQIPRLRIWIGKRAMRVCYVVLGLLMLGVLSFIGFYMSGLSQTFLIVSIFLISLFAQYGKLIFRTLDMSATWKQLTHLHGICRLDASDEGLRFEYPLFRMEHDWRGVTSWIESRGTFLVLLPAKRFHIIPKRAFRDPEEQDEFRNLLIHNTSEQKPAFPVIPMATVASPADQPSVPDARIAENGG